MIITADPFTPLVTIRDTKIYSARNTSKAAILPELHRLLSALANGYSREKAKQLVIIENLLNKKTFYNRRTIWDRLSFRYFNAKTVWVSECLITAEANGVSSSEFLSLSYLYYALRDRITFDFVTSIIWEKWQARSTHISTGDFADFLQIAQEKSPELKTWRESTQTRLGQNTLTALRDFGLLTGTAIKHIQRPTISAETTYHLLAILWAEGKRGRSILEAVDWKLFLWNDSDTTDALIQLAQLGWIKFERGGQTVILDMVRMPGVESESAHGE